MMADDPETALKRAIEGYGAGRELDRQRHRDRMAGLYVDLNDSDVVSPIDISREEADRGISAARALYARLVAD